CQKYTSTPFTF
nr:immunoglobulin light chain junction region [Macaca mulatta]MOW66059.1 immunoglobulin light chain junction region [Macaca mulatta]